MDFDKEAREIASGVACGNCDGADMRKCNRADGCTELAKEISQALRRAFVAGQMEMRESSAGLCDSYDVADQSPELLSASKEAANILADSIRTLPLKEEA